MCVHECTIFQDFDARVFKISRLRFPEFPDFDRSELEDFKMSPVAFLYRFFKRHFQDSKSPKFSKRHFQEFKGSRFCKTQSQDFKLL